MGKCKKCNGPTKGYKCDVCGATAKRHDSKHSCGSRQKQSADVIVNP